LALVEQDVTRYPAEMSSPAEYAFQFYRNLGYDAVDAAAIVGTLQQESGPGLDVQAIGDNGTAYGIAQWRHDRLDNLKRFAADRGASADDLDTQLAFVDHELKTSESGAGRRLLDTQSLDDAAAAMIGYERPLGWTVQNPQAGHGYSARLRNAQALLGAPPSGPVPKPISQKGGGAVSQTATQTYNNAPAAVPQSSAGAERAIPPPQPPQNPTNAMMMALMQPPEPPMPMSPPMPAGPALEAPAPEMPPVQPPPMEMPPIRVSPEAMSTSLTPLSPAMSTLQKFKRKPPPLLAA
jgi:hypothetical protein